MRSVYGPIETAHFGTVLGVDMVTSQRKYCSYDCIYCQSARRTHGVARRRQYVGLTWVEAILEKEKPFNVDYVVFSGMGEPTLASNLGDAIDLVKSSLGLPVAVLTNSSLIPKEDVRRDLSKADVVVAKLDAPNDELFQQINRPFVPYSVDEILAGLQQFRSEYQGRLVLQPTLIAQNSDVAGELAAIAKRLSPCEVELNTPLACKMQLSAEDLDRARLNFAETKTTSVFDSRESVEDPFALRMPPLRPAASVMLMSWAMA